ncbi:hypothetical protein ACTWQF_18760 [Streptomyces sp. 8N114]|uniref:hypothetical protein n=1 Tax=Streptomyces sp. 8N114 TaxID=3457419 RepID=UPI003FD0A37A
MSSNDRPTGADGEPAAMHNGGADVSKSPTSPGGEAAAIVSSVERFRAQMMKAVEEFDRARRAELIAAGGDSENGPDPLGYVRWIADRYDQRRDDCKETAAFLDGFAHELDLDDVRALRIAGEVAQAVTPRVVEDAAIRGMKPDRIAAAIGLTPSRVYGLLREQRQQRVRTMVEGGVSADKAARDNPRDALIRYTATLDAVQLDGPELRAAEQFLSQLRAAVEEHEGKYEGEQRTPAHDTA